MSLLFFLYSRCVIYDVITNNYSASAAVLCDVRARLEAKRLQLASKRLQLANKRLQLARLAVDSSVANHRIYSNERTLE
jgi:hypothetical protein